jgi:hypothetical protein
MRGGTKARFIQGHSGDALSEQVSKMNDVPGQLAANGKSKAIQISGLEPFVICCFKVIEYKGARSLSRSA